MSLTTNNGQTLDVVIATYNRSALLSKALKSLIAAKRPEDLSISVIVVDNNSTDNTRTVVEEIAGGGGRHSPSAISLSQDKESHTP